MVFYHILETALNLQLLKFFSVIIIRIYLSILQLYSVMSIESFLLIECTTSCSTVIILRGKIGILVNKILNSSTFYYKEDLFLALSWAYN